MDFILGFGSPHKALKAEDILLKASITFKLMPVPKGLDASCGLVILIKDGIDGALGALERGGLRPKSIYRKEGEGYVKV